MRGSPGVSGWTRERTGDQQPPRKTWFARFLESTRSFDATSFQSRFRPGPAVSAVPRSRVSQLPGPGTALGAARPTRRTRADISRTTERPVKTQIL